MSAFYFNILRSVAVVVFDTPGKKVNIFNRDSFGDFEEILDQLEEIGSDLKGAIITSAKEKNFIAGADISLIAGITDPEQGAGMARKGQELFDRVAALPFKTVSAIHGSCLGGGLELALACDHRVASDDAGTFMGLPETRLGIIPGFGGTQRLPRLVGLLEAVKMITTGSPAYAQKAYRIGLVDEVTKREHLMDAAMSFFTGNIPPTKKDRRENHGARVEAILEKTLLGRKILLSKARKAVLANTRGHYPAPLAAIDAIEYGLNRGLVKGLINESRLFGEMAANSVSKNLIRVFQLRESFAKGDPASARNINNLAVIGGGALGGGIAALVAEHGMHVRLVDKSEKALGAAIKLLSDNVVKKHRKHHYTSVAADWIPTRLTVDTKMRGIGAADVVIEAVAERMDVKKSVFTSAAEKVSDSSTILTSTSSLAVSELAVDVPNPERVAGLHFFDPVDKMPLVEVVKGEKTSEETAARMAAFARKLGKIPIIVKDSPGFLVNRLLFPCFNEACLLLQDGADIRQVDKVLQEFGMTMGAFILLDQIGIDIVDQAGRNMHDSFGDRMTPSPILSTMSGSGRMGKKTGKGFYIYDRSAKHQPDPEINKLLAPHMNGKTTFTSDQIVPRLIYSMINEATLCLEEGVVDSAEAVDNGMILGAGFPPFTGGLLRYADSTGIKEMTSALTTLSEEVHNRFTPSAMLVKMAEGGERFYSE